MTIAIIPNGLLRRAELELITAALSVKGALWHLSFLTSNLLCSEQGLELPFVNYLPLEEFDGNLAFGRLFAQRLRSGRIIAGRNSKSVFRDDDYY